MDAKMGKLDIEPALARADLLAPPVAAALAALDGTLPPDARCREQSRRAYVRLQ